MSHPYSFRAVAVSALLAMSSSILSAQSKAAPPRSSASGAVTDSNPQVNPAPKKKGGLFGKVKGLAKNNVVKTIAKTAACTMIPGGQLVAGAIEGVSAKSAAKDAATNAATNAAAKAAKGVVAGAAAGALAGAGKGGNPCMPGMGMMANPGAAAMASGVPGAGLPGLPNTTMPGVGLSPSQLTQMQEQYQKMGMNPEQIKAMQQQMQMAAAATPGAAMPAGGISPEQMKQMMEQYRKMGIDPAQLAAMQKRMAATQGGGKAEQPNVTASAAAAPMPAAAPSLTKEKGKLVLRQVPWAPGSEAILPGAKPTFGLAIHDLATTILNGSARYKVEARVEDQGSKAASRALAQKRAVVAITALIAQGVPQPRLVAADGGSDKDPKLVVSETK